MKDWMIREDIQGLRGLQTFFRSNLAEISQYAYKADGTPSTQWKMGVQLDWDVIEWFFAQDQLEGLKDCVRVKLSRAMEAIKSLQAKLEELSFILSKRCYSNRLFRILCMHKLQTRLLERFLCVFV